MLGWEEGHRGGERLCWTRAAGRRADEGGGVLGGREGTPPPSSALFAAAVVQPPPSTALLPSVSFSTLALLPAAAFDPPPAAAQPALPCSQSLPSMAGPLLSTTQAAAALVQSSAHLPTALIGPPNRASLHLGPPPNHPRRPSSSHRIRPSSQHALPCSQPLLSMDGPPLPDAALVGPLPIRPPPSRCPRPSSQLPSAILLSAAQPALPCT